MTADLPPAGSFAVGISCMFSWAWIEGAASAKVVADGCEDERAGAAGAAAGIDGKSGIGMEDGTAEPTIA